MRTPYGWRVAEDYALRPPTGQSEWLDGTYETDLDFHKACRRVRQALRASQVRRQEQKAEKVSRP